MSRSGLGVGSLSAKLSVEVQQGEAWGENGGDVGIRVMVRLTSLPLGLQSGLQVWH